jgi:hypothetical protein
MRITVMAEIQPWIRSETKSSLDRQFNSSMLALILPAYGGMMPNEELLDRGHKFQRKLQRKGCG